MDEEDRTPFSTDEAGSNTVLPRNDSEPKFTIKLTIPGYTAVMDDGSRKSFESSDHVLEVIPDGYLMVNLVAAVAVRRKWGTCQEATFWIWNVEKKGMPAYKFNVALDHKLEKLPIRRNPNVSWESASLGESDDESVEEEDNVDPALMVDEDIFLEDNEVFVSLGLRAEEVAARKNMDQDGLGLNDDEPVHDLADDEPRFTIDTENPKIRKGETFPTMVDFRMDLKHFAIQNEFEVHKVRTDKKRYRAEYKANGCPWRIVANKLVGQPPVEITMIPHEHECVGTGKLVSSMASHKWVAERVISWLRKKPELGAGELQDRLLEKYSVEVHCNTVWLSRQKAMEAIYGSWEESFENLFNFRAELIQRSPGTILEIATIEVEAGIRFDKLFICLRQCMDGFLNACRPYLGIDSTALNGKYKGQLAAATAIDGNNWMYPVAWAFFDTESSDNWTWFMRQLENVMGHPSILAISTNACKGLNAAMKMVFPEVKHRECMRYLWANFKKKYRGDVFDKNMWPVARAYKSDKFHYHYNKVIDADPEVVEYMKLHHPNRWSRSMFSNDIKCDYVNNNISESFNQWIKKIKDLPPVDLLDKLRQMTMDLWDRRRRIGEKLAGNILPTIVKQLKAQTRGLGHMKIYKGAHTAEVFGTYYDMTPWRHVVELKTHTCSYGEWQMTGKPCLHALAFLQMIPDLDMGSYVHEYYSVERFKAAYSGTIPPMTDKSQWPQVDMGFKLLPPPLKRAPGRQKKNRFKASHEPGARKQKRCNKCGAFGHRENGNCPLNEPKKRKRVSKPKRKPQMPKIVAGGTISPGSIARRLSNLVEDG